MASKVSAKRRPSVNAPSEGVTSAKKRKTAMRERTPGFADAMFSETTYCIKNGLRHVVPYYFTFTSYAKGRWVGSTVYEVFCKEFQSEKPEYYEFAIKTGKVTVNDVKASMETRIRDNDIIAHRVHRHEPPVAAGEIDVVFEDNNIIVVNKPSSIPVHPCGRYRHNTVLFILGKERGLRNLRTAHRLDRLTSGLLIIAKNLSTAQRIESEIRQRDISKEYVCRVKGEFPEGDVECNEPILVVSHKLGVCKVDPSGKPCSTIFQRLSFNGTSSVVKCFPRTGRMHQIRVHLQWLGYPIVNDPLYNSKAWGPSCGSGGKGTENMEQVIEDITRANFSNETVSPPGTTHSTTTHSTTTHSTTTHSTTTAHSTTTHSTSHEHSRDTGCDTPEHLSEEDEEEKSSSKQDVLIDKKEEETVEEGDKIFQNTALSQVTEEGSFGVEKTETPVGNERLEPGSSSKEVDTSFDPDCTECRLCRPDPSPGDLVMYLHAISYKGPNWEYQTSPPPWAAADFKETL